LVGRNVAALVKTPHGRSGRASKSFTLEQAKALLAASESTRLHAYVVLSLLVGIRTEEARALRWDHVVTWVDDSAGWQPVTSAGFDPARACEGRYAIYVWRSDRYGGDTKTEKSRRTLALPQRCVEALRQHMKRQEKERLRAGELWQEHGLVFASRIGTPLTANNVIRAFRMITKKAGLGEDWVPREMRHTFVSVLSANGVPVESIALLAGHERSATTEGRRQGWCTASYQRSATPALVLRRAGQRQVSPVSGQQPVQPRRRLGDDLRGFTSQLLVPGAGSVCPRPVRLMYGADPLAAPGVLRDSGTAVPETVVAAGVQVQHPAAQDPAGARTDSSPADLVRELVHGRTPVLDR
jgi:hypothetical protein